MKRYSQQDIANLLDRFMDGQTSVEEEKALADYFRTHDVPAEWEDYRIMFSYFDSGMEGELLPEKEPDMRLTSMMGRRWWGIGAAAAITALIAGTAVLHHTTPSAQQQTDIIAHSNGDTIVSPPAAAENLQQQLASTNIEHPATPVSPTKQVSHPRHATNSLQVRNDSLARENERLQRELADLKRRAFIIDLEANGFKTVLNEDGNIVLIDMEQEIENELNDQPTTNLPSI